MDRIVRSQTLHNRNNAIIPVLTGIKDVDRFILLQVNVEDYPRLKLTCRYLYYLLSEDSFWREKLSSLFGRVIVDDAIPISWHRWYLFWSKHVYALKLVQTLNLTLKQVYLSICASEGKLYRGVEAFQTIERTLIQALKTKDPSLIEYYIEQYRRIYKKLRETNKYRHHIATMINYSEILDLVLELNLDNLAEELVKDYCDVRIMNSKTIEVLGRWNQTELFTKYILPHANNPTSWMVDGAKEDFIKGQIKAGRMELIPDLVDRFYYFSEKSRRDRLILYWQKQYKEEEEIIIPYEREKKQSVRFSCDELLELYYGDVFSVLSSCISKGRYDVILSIEDYFTDGLINLTCVEWANILRDAHFSPYKDLYLYLIVKCARQHPDYCRNILIHMKEYYHENSLLCDSILNIPFDKLPETDFYSLLMEPYM